MVRANRHHLPGYVWHYGGYHEIQNPKQRHSLINRQQLTALLGIKDNDQLSEYHRHWVEEVLKNGSNQRDAKWTESIAVGDKEYVMETKAFRQQANGSLYQGSSENGFLGPVRPKVL